MERIFLTQYLIVFASGYKGVQIFVSDNEEAIRVAYSTVSIWEPNPPNNNFFVLGQYFFRTGEPPGVQNKLIVAKSEDDSLQPPLEFNGKWKITSDITIWTMRCPDGYVALGAIATRNRKQPEVTKYRCVIRREVVEAEMSEVLIPPRHGHVNSLRSVRSRYGEENNFFVIDYRNQTQPHVQTTPYALKQSQIVERADPDSTLITTSNGNENVAKSYLTLIVSGVFLLFLISVFAFLFCLRTRRLQYRRSRNNSVSFSTGHTFIDSAKPLNSTVSESSANGSINVTNFISSQRCSLPKPCKYDKEQSVKKYSSQRSEWKKFEVKDNVLYESVSQRTESVENEYEIINEQKA